MKTDLEQKWAEVLDYALQHATGQGSRTGFRWLEDAFNEYFQAHEEAVENGTFIDEDQEARLKASLKEITESSQRSRGFRR